MKTITAILMLIALIGCGNRAKQDADYEISMLKEFYKEYISLNLCEKVDDTALSNLKKKYVSPNL